MEATGEEKRCMAREEKRDKGQSDIEGSKLKESKSRGRRTSCKMTTASSPPHLKKTKGTASSCRVNGCPPHLPGPRHTQERCGCSKIQGSHDTAKFSSGSAHVPAAADRGFAAETNRRRECNQNCVSHMDLCGARVKVHQDYPCECAAALRKSQLATSAHLPTPVQ